MGQIKSDEVNALVASRLAEVQERIAHKTQRVAQIRDELTRLAE